MAAVLCGPACHKNTANFAESQQDLISKACLLIDSISSHGQPTNYRASAPKKIRWDLAEITHVGSSPALMAPIVFDNDLLMTSNLTGGRLFHLSYLTKLLFHVDSTGKQVALVSTAFPDSNHFKDPTRSFTGIKFIEDWQGNIIEKLLYSRS